MAFSSSPAIWSSVEFGVGSVVPFDRQRGQSLLRRAHMVGNNGDGVVEPHDLTHALDRLGRRVVHALHATAEDGRLRERRDFHARRSSVDAIDGRSVDLGWSIEPLGRCADEIEIPLTLEDDACRDRHGGRVCGKLAISEASSRRSVEHFAAIRTAGLRIDIPAFCRRRHEHCSCGRACPPHRLPRRGDRSGAACRLHSADQGVSVELFVGRSVLQPHLIETDLQFFGDQHRNCGVVALAHLDIGHGEDDLTIAVDTDEGVRCKDAGVTRFGFCALRWQAQTQHQAAAGCRSDL